MKHCALLVVLFLIAGCGERAAPVRAVGGTTAAQTEPDDPSAGDVVPELEGVYCTPEEISGFSGTLLELKGGRFRYWFYSDVRFEDEPKYPLSGPYAFRDGKVIVSHKRISQEEWVPDCVNGLPVLWRSDGLKIWREKKAIYDYAVLIKIEAAVADEAAVIRPSVRVLYDAETRKRVKEWKDPFVHGPTPVAPPAFNGAKAGDEREVAGIKLCWCPPGKFMMGSPRSEPERRPGEDQVQVTLTKGFWMAKYEATQGQWRWVMGKLPGELTAELPEGDDYPVGNVNFAETEAFCRKLTALGHESGDLPKGSEVRLPTEAQWEYACRAGTTTATAFGDKLSSKQANFKGKPYNGAEPGPSLNRAAKVGSYPANAWGICDMHGNIFEWCRDWYHAKLPGGVDPDLYFAKDTALKNRTGDVSRVRRGGCWADHGWPCRSACRLRFEPERRYDHIGFRVVAVQP